MRRVAPGNRIDNRGRTTAGKRRCRGLVAATGGQAISTAVVVATQAMRCQRFLAAIGGRGTGIHLRITGHAIVKIFNSHGPGLMGALVMANLAVLLGDHRGTAADMAAETVELGGDDRPGYAALFRRVTSDAVTRALELIVVLVARSAMRFRRTAIA